MDPPKLYPGPTIQPRPTARRAAKGLVKIMDGWISKIMDGRIIKICRYCGQYLVGHAFATNPDLENIIFQVCCSPGYCYTLCQGSNSTGQTLRTKGKERLMRWLDFRGRFGFSEYNADTYGPISFAPLVTVAALAPDPEVPPPQLAYFFFPS